MLRSSLILLNWSQRPFMTGSFIKQFLQPVLTFLFTANSRTFLTDISGFLFRSLSCFLLMLSCSFFHLRPAYLVSSPWQLRMLNCDSSPHLTSRTCCAILLSSSFVLTSLVCLCSHHLLFLAVSHKVMLVPTFSYFTHSTSFFPTTP